MRQYLAVSSAVFVSFPTSSVKTTIITFFFGADVRNTLAASAAVRIARKVISAPDSSTGIDLIAFTTSSTSAVGFLVTTPTDWPNAITRFVRLSLFAPDRVVPSSLKTRSRRSAI